MDDRPRPFEGGRANGSTDRPLPSKPNNSFGSDEFDERAAAVETLDGTASRVSLADELAFETALPAQVPGDMGDRTGSGQNLSSATRKGVAWSGFSKISIQALQFVTTVVLARLLTPSDYGLVAIELALVGFAWTFTDLGLGAAVVHYIDRDDELLDTAFWVNAISGLLLTLLFCGLAEPIALFYGQPKLVWLVVLGSLTFATSMSTVQLALLERSMNFRRIAAIEFTAIIVYSAFAIGLAVAHLGPFSLVIANQIQTVFTTIAMWRGVRWWHPSMRFSRSAVRDLWAYSSHLVGFNVVNYWSRNTDNIVVGKVLGAGPLGLYARAYNLMMLPVQQVTGVVGRVLFPAFSRLGDDRARLRDAYLRSLRVMTSVAFPIGFALASCATPFVSVLYGSRWVGVGPILSALALSAPAQVIGGTIGALFQALGLTAQQFRRGLVSAAGTVIAVFAGLHWGLLGIAIALCIKFWVLLPINTRVAWKCIDLSASTAVRNLWPVALSSLLMTAAMVVVGRIVTTGRPAQLGCELVAGGVVYVGTMAIVGRPLLVELLAALGRKRRPTRARHRFARGRV